MTLQSPKKTAAGFFLAMTPPVSSPVLSWTAEGAWTPKAEWSTWATRQRADLLESLLSNPKWFSKPPRRDILEPLFSPWDGRNMQGVHNFFCQTPEIPEAGINGTAVWQLQGLTMSSTAINPIWSLDHITKEERVEAISLFDDSKTVDSSVGDEREIQLEDMDGPPDPAPVTRIRNREWETKKFLSKERVREARLKAQIAVRMARSEEARFYRMFGDLDDAESNFSDYDISPSSSDGESE